MLKSRVFSFNEQNLLRDIEEYRKTGREVSELQCNQATAYVWSGMHRDELNYPVEYSADDRPKGILGKCQGIPIIINETLDDGTINIK